jgi:hypothetical protein
MRKLPWTLAILAAGLASACEQELELAGGACVPYGSIGPDGTWSPFSDPADPVDVPASFVGRPIDAGPEPEGRRVDVNKVDLLFVIDNSGTMREEQEALVREFPGMLAVLASGDRDGDGAADFPKIADLHVGVASTEVFIGNFEVDKCQPPTDDGRLLDGDPRAGGCTRPATGPPFLSFRAHEASSPDQLASDFACLARLGTDGCGFEQQLEATLQAVLLSDEVTNVNPFWDGGSAQPESMPLANFGFARPAVGPDASLLVVVLITDEDDCSAADRRLYAPSETLSPSDPLVVQPLDQRCSHNPDLLHPVGHYAQAFLALRNAPLFLFMAIAGVPNDLVDAAARSRVDFADLGARNAYYEAILQDPRMQEVLVPPTDPADFERLRPSCESETARALPPRRLVQTVQTLGEHGALHSLCSGDFGDALDLLIERIGLKLEDACVEVEE